MENGYCSLADRNLICYGDYLLGNIDLDNMVANLQIKNGNRDGQYDIEKKNKLLVEKLQDLLEQGDTTAKKKICELIKASKSVNGVH